MLHPGAPSRRARRRSCHDGVADLSTEPNLRSDNDHCHPRHHAPVGMAPIMIPAATLGQRQYGFRVTDAITLSVRDLHRCGYWSLDTND